MRLPSCLRRSLNIERLEDRTVPAGISGTIQNGVLTVLGTPGDDTIVVHYANKVVSVDGLKLEAEAGRIVIDAGAGNDVIRLDTQDPLPVRVPATVYCGDGNDLVYSTNCGDIVYGQNGNDTLIGGGARDYLNGGDGNDVIDGAGGDDILNGGAGNDTITGNTGNDTIYGDVGNDTVDGAAGNDALFGDAGTDNINGSAGNDTVNGGTGDDYLEGGTGDDLVIGGAGRDALNGGDGFDTYQDDYVAPTAATTPAAVTAGIASKKAGETQAALPADIRQQIADTCSLLASLSAFARSSPTDLAQRITYDASQGKYLVPMFVNNQWQNVPVNFNGSWTDNEPYPGADDGTGARDYWPVIYQRAYLQSQNVDTSAADAHQWAVQGTSASQLTAQLWRYPDVALKAVTGRGIGTDSFINDSDLATIQGALAAGRDVIANTWTVTSMQPQVTGTGLVFSHTYAIVGVTSDSTGAIVTLRNPWGLDNKSSALSSLSTSNRSFFTSGNENDGLVQVRWDTFKQAFATYVYEVSL
ncbi:MAG TPA: C2 family cysteine protease [Gemmataceae bacterium]|nr:C2 family cysteine protease [Gemmataceae bacterium]